MTCGARGLPISVVEAGPPDKITAFGLSAEKPVPALWNGTTSQ